MPLGNKASAMADPRDPFARGWEPQSVRDAYDAQLRTELEQRQEQRAKAGR